jgi:lysozyme family protein
MLCELEGPGAGLHEGGAARYAGWSRINQRRRHRSAASIESGRKRGWQNLVTVNDTEHREGLMTTTALARALPFVLRWEGGFVDDPDDPGGRTNQGITQKVYDAWRRRQGLAARDVKLIEDAEVRAVYETHYWVPPRCDLLNDPLNLVQFDTAVNMGVGRAVRFLQTAAGCDVDGDFGPGTARAIAACDHGSLVAKYCNTRENFYRALVVKNAVLGKFLKGWLNRLDSLRAAAGLAGFESASPLDYGEAGFIKKIPDLGIDPAFDLSGF